MTVYNPPHSPSSAVLDLASTTKNIKSQENYVLPKKEIRVLCTTD
jgi:hypothetical protein